MRLTLGALAIPGDVVPAFEWNTPMVLVVKFSGKAVPVFTSTVIRGWPHLGEVTFFADPGVGGQSPPHP